MRRVVSILLAGSLFWPLLSFGASGGLPSSVTIYQTLDGLWREGLFRELDDYIHELQSNHGSYLPVQIAYATYSFRCDVDVQKAISALKEVRESLNRDLVFASPMFMDLLDGKIYRYEDTARYYSKRGYTREYLLASIDPRKMDPAKRSKSWGDEMLYYNAPEVLLTENGIIPALPEETPAPDATLKQKDAQELLQSVGNHKESMRTRKAAVKELIRKRVAEENLKQLAQGLHEANMVYTYRDTVEALASVGKDAVPVTLEALNDPASSNTDKKCAIWALVRIGVASPEVIQSLRTIAEGSDRAGVADYAERAYKYLQRR